MTHFLIVFLSITFSLETTKYHSK